MGFLDKLEKTLKGAADLALFAPGAAIDMARTVLPGKENTISEAIDRSAGRLGGAADLLISDGTLTGVALNTVGDAFESVYQKGSNLIEQPLTAATAQIQGTGSVFSAETWAKAHEVAKNRTLGQSLVLAKDAALQPLDGSLAGEITGQLTTGALPGMVNTLFGGGQATANAASSNVLQDDAWTEFAKQSPLATSWDSGSADFAARIFLDPGIVAGKAFKLQRAARTGERLAETNKARELMDTKRVGVKQFLFKGETAQKSQVDDYLGKLDESGKFKAGYIQNKNAWQIYKGTPELANMVDGRAVASLLDDSKKIENEADRLNVQKDILATIRGDQGALKRLNEAQPYLSDRLSNLYTGRSIGSEQKEIAEGLGQTPSFFSEPEVVAEKLRQVENTPGSADWLFAQHNRNIANVTPKGQRALAREDQRGLLRNGELVTGSDAIDRTVGKVLNPVAQTWIKAEQSMFVKDVDSTPVRYLRKPLQLATVSVPATVRGGYTLSDKLRRTYNPGRIDLNRADVVENVLGSDLTRFGVDEAQRFAIMDGVTKAQTNVERQVSIVRAERAITRTLAAKYGVDEDFAEELVKRGQKSRDMLDQQIAGRAYAAQLDPTGYKNPTTGETLRVDQIVDQDTGDVIALPIAETQLTNSTSMINFSIMEKELQRNGGTLAKLARDWKYEQSTAKRGVARVGKAISGEAGNAAETSMRADAIDRVELGLQSVNRAWKAGVLLRLGYAQRNIGDEWMRIAAKGLSGVMANQLAEGAKLAYKNLTSGRGENVKEMVMLRQRRDYLAQRLDDPNLNRTHDEANAEIDRLNRLLGKAEGRTGREAVGVREKMQARLDFLQDTARTSIDDERRELREIETLLKDRSYKKRRYRYGQDDIEFGDNAIPGAFAGEHGAAARMIASESNVTDQDMQVIERGMVKDMREGMSFKTYSPLEDTEGHLNAWEWAINKQLRQSPLMQAAMKAETSEELAQWIRTTPEGRKAQELLPHMAGRRGQGIDRWAAGAKQVVDEVVPTQELRDILATRQVSKTDLSRLFPDVANRPHVNGRNLDANLGQGEAGWWMKVTNKAFENLATRPSDALVRHPLFVSLYNDETRRLAATFARKIANEEGVDPKNVKFSTETVEQISKRARRTAQKGLQDTLFDVTAQSEMAHTLRFISPFFAAHQEALKRWGGIVANDPSVVRKFQLAFDAPRNLGLVIDENGEPVKKGEFPSDKHRIVLQLPHAWGGKDVREYQSQWQFAESSLNLILQGGSILNPGGGPLVQIPAGELAKKWADHEEITKLTKVVNPWGPSDGVFDPLIPASVNRINTAVQATVGKHTDEFNRVYATQLQASVVDFHKANGRYPSKYEQRQMELDAEQETKGIVRLRVLTSLTAPVPAQPRSKYQAYIDAYRKLQEQQFAEDKPFDWATNKFIEEYGDSYFALTKSASVNSGNLTATPDTVGALKRNASLVKKVDPRLARAIVGPDNDGQYDVNSRRYLQSTTNGPGGEAWIGTKDPGTAASDTSISAGWSDYNKFTTALQVEAQNMGLDSYKDSDELVAIRKAVVAKMGEKNPQWFQEMNSFSKGKYNQEILPGLQMIAKDKKLSRDTGRPDVQILGQWLDVRADIQAELDQRKAAGGSGEIYAQSNRDLSQIFTLVTNKMVKSSTYFEDNFYSGIIESDPLLRQG